MKKAIDVEKLTEQLISIPSFVNKEINEKSVADFIANLLYKEGFNVQKQQIELNRYNLIATIGNPRLWLCGHMDTVEPKNRKQLTPKYNRGKLYGLGAVDMKGGIAAILAAVNSAKIKNNLGLLFYCDEEYHFKGMRTFIKNFDARSSLAIFAEPTNLAVSNAHRGLIELYAVIKGKSGHAARPEEGKNAIVGTSKAITSLATILAQNYSSSEAGQTTCTLSSMRGGTQMEIKNQNIIYAQGTNSIPDTTEINLDIRPAKIGLCSNKIISLLKKCVKKEGLILKTVKVKEDLGPLITPKNQLKILETIIGEEIGCVNYLPSQKMGYGDGQLLFEKTKTPVVYLGPGPTEACHKEDEYVTLDSLEKTTRIFKRLIEEYAKGE